MLTVHSTPELRSPILLCAFSGWADASSAASGALRYLLLKREGQRIASFDPDAIYSYTTTRPLNLFDSKGERRLEWPALDIVAVEVPEAPSDLLIMVGPEPDLRWREWARTLSSYVSRLNISTVITFGAFLAQVNFAGPPVMTGTASDIRIRARLRRLGLEDSSYQGPTGITSVILRSAIEVGIPAASIWVAAPSYLSSTSNPKLAAALLRAAEKLIGQSLWTDELEAAGRDMEQRIRDALKSRPDLINFLRKLRGETAEPSNEEADSPKDADLSQAENEAQDVIPEEAEELPSSDEILRSLEEHLRKLKGNGGQGYGDMD